MAAIAKRSRVHYSGVGWQDWTGSLTCQQNIDRLMPEADLVVWYKPLEMNHPDRVTVPTCLRYNEMWDTEATVTEIAATRTEIVICHHLNDWRAYADKIKGVEFRHIAHCVDPKVFYATQRNRDTNVMLAGHLRENVYPLRSRFEGMIRSGLIQGEVREHPGYQLDNVHAEQRSYARSLRGTKIALVCCSKYRYRLAKIVEAAMSGCLVVGDLPDGEQEECGRFMVECRPDEPDQAIAERIEWWLAHDKEREIRAYVGRRMMMERYTTSHYAARFLTVAREFLESRKATLCH